jgi:hypothetical protein
MIVDLPDTTTSKVSKKLMALRDQGGVIALGRVLTLVVVTKSGLEEEAIEAANDASREHPCRIIVLADAGSAAEDKLDAQIRVGGDAGASEVIVLRGYGKLAHENESLVAALLPSGRSRTAGSPTPQMNRTRRQHWRESTRPTGPGTRTWPGPA